MKTCCLKPTETTGIAVLMFILNDSAKLHSNFLFNLHGPAELSLFGLYIPITNGSLVSYIDFAGSYAGNTVNLTETRHVMLQSAFDTIRIEISGADVNYIYWILLPSLDCFFYKSRGNKFVVTDLICVAAFLIFNFDLN